MVWNSLSEVYDGTWKDDKPDGKGEHVWIGLKPLVGAIWVTNMRPILAWQYICVHDVCTTWNPRSKWY